MIPDVVHPHGRMFPVNQWETKMPEVGVDPAAPPRQPWWESLWAWFVGGQD